MDKLHFERFLIQTGFDAKDLDVFIERKLVEAYYKKLGFLVIPGFDFENNIIFTLKYQFSYLDPYLKVKLGHAKGSASITAYGNQVLDYIGGQDIILMLYLCRLCSYVGGPGFPDFIVAEPQTRKWFLAIVAEELPQEYVLFAYMARLLGFDIRISNIQRAGLDKGLTIDVKKVLEAIASTERFKNFDGSIEEEIASLKKAQETENTKDEIAFLEEQRYKMPFFLIKKWMKSDAKKDDILLAYEDFEKSNANMKALASQITKEMPHNDEYTAIGSSKDEETLKKKFAWLMKAFGMGESRAKELLGLVI